ncbi:MAG: hypothetical protein JNM56_28945 [Planctomycetia bacterium]|nr:hypothetical protein [Planctomycetia bacterium]
MTELSNESSREPQPFSREPEASAPAPASAPLVEALTLPRFEKPLQVSIKEARLLTSAPWVRSLGKLALEVSTEGWKFPAPPAESAPGEKQVLKLVPPDAKAAPGNEAAKQVTRLKPPADAVVFKDRLLYLLQPPLESIFAGRQVELPFKPFPYQIEGIAFLMPRHAALLADEMGLGKAQPLDAKILTPTGWKRMGDMQPNDEVVNPEGGVSRVAAVYPQGEKEIFRVEFSDGSATECCDEHLWEVNTPLRKYRGQPGRVLPLKDIAASLAHRNGNRQHFIPMVRPVEFREVDLPLHPYLLGALLGDGCLAAHFVQFASNDLELIERLRSVLPDGVNITHVAGCGWNLTGPGRLKPNPLIATLRALGLMGTRSETKFIPEAYKLASVAARTALLQALLDTDGHVREDNNIEYCTVSPQLAQDVQFLVQSLGGVARIRSKPTTHQLAYRMSVALPAEVAPFALSRKANAYHPRGKYPPARAIVSVTPVGRKPAQCIAVDAPNQLYVTDDFIVTHNTMQTIVSLRLMFHAGLIQRALLVCPKPLVPNWSRELKLWAPDLPFEVINGDTKTRRAMWNVSNCPLKLVNFELLTRDADIVDRDDLKFDVVVLDEAQRIKNRESKTAQVVRSIRRERSWALTGTPVENRPEDLVNLFAFVDPERIPSDTPPRQLARLTSDCILRRTTDKVLTEMPPKIIRDTYLELTPAQRESYAMAEKEGVIRLNNLGDTITVQHVFELVMRLKQICNFDPVTGDSAKLERMQADMVEVAESGKKAIVFSQWVEPLEAIAKALKDLGPLQYHGRIPHPERQPILDQFRNDPKKHVLLMSYGTGSVGLNLQFSNYVFLFDRWWNPAIEDQAIKRAHRLGQKEPVFVTRFVVQDSIEGRIAAVLDKKRELFNELLEQNGPPVQLGLSQDEIFGLFDIRQRAAKAA